MRGKYRVFTRTWWRENPKWPNGLEPWPGRETTLKTFDTAEEARACAEAWNASHAPGRLSLKAEWEGE